MSILSSYFATKRNGLLILFIFTLGITALSLIFGDFDLLSAPSSFKGVLMTYLSYSAGSEGFLITLGILTIALFAITQNKKYFVKVMLCFGVILLLCFVGKTALKQVTQSPRPYTEALIQLKLIETAQQFYHSSKETKNQLVQAAGKQVSKYRFIHWQHETDYAFPSGHSMFVIACLAFFGGIFWGEKRYVVTIILLIWGLGVVYSRLWLGMHRPEDLFGSMAFIVLLYLLVPLPKPQKSPKIKNFP